MSSCLSPCTTACDDGPILYRDNGRQVVKKRETLPEGTAYWNVHKYGVYCAKHAAEHVTNYQNRMAKRY